MIRRMRGKGYSKFRFPHKGRIRFILVLSAVIVGFKVCGALFHADSSSTGAVADGENAKAKKNLKLWHGKEIAPSDIQEILNLHSPKFVNKDTMVAGSDSLVFHYSIDTALQNFGSRLIKQYHPKYGAVVAIQPNTGRVLALISYTNDSVPDLGSKLYCSSIFPAASIFKTITAAAAVERANYTSHSPVQLVGRNHTLYKSQLVKDVRSYKEIPLEEAYAQSVNPVFARLGMYALGESVLNEYEQKFGFNSDIPFDLKNDVSKPASLDSNCSIAELASGFNQKTTISPLFGALIAASIAEQGKMPQPILVDSITKDTSCMYRSVARTWRSPINESTSSELRRMMSCVALKGTARKSFKYIHQSDRFSDLEYGGKTGSIDKDNTGRVDWFIGFARDPSDPRQHISVGIVTVHGAYWTVHSSFIGAELFRIYLRSIQKEKKKIEKERNLVNSDSLPQPDNNETNM